MQKEPRIDQLAAWPATPRYWIFVAEVLLQSHLSHDQQKRADRQSHRHLGDVPRSLRRLLWKGRGFWWEVKGLVVEATTGYCQEWQILRRLLQAQKQAAWHDFEQSQASPGPLAGPSHRFFYPKIYWGVDAGVRRAGNGGVWEICGGCLGEKWGGCFGNESWMCRIQWEIELLKLTLSNCHTTYWKWHLEKRGSFLLRVSEQQRVNIFRTN